MIEHTFFLPIFTAAIHEKYFKIFLLFHSAVVNNKPVKEKIKSFLIKEKCGPNRFNHGWKQIRTRGVAEKQEFTLKMYEKVWSRFNQGIM